jgi:hypothetical protein
MTRQAAPPAHRWLLLFVVLVSASWLGQGGAAGAATIGLDPPSGGPGSTVNVTLTDFFDACIVIFDEEVVAIGQGCAETTLTFTVPESASVGEHQIRAVGQTGEESVEEVATFEVTGAAPVSTTIPQSAGPPATGVPASVPPLPAATCGPGQVALMRFDLQPPRAEAGASVSAATTWGSVGTCTQVRPLLVLFDGTPVTGQPPAAGTPGVFRITIPDGARSGPHRITLVAADDESVELSSLAFDVVDADASTLPLIVGAAAGGVLLLLLVLLMVRRRRQRRRREGPPPPTGVARLPDGDDLWAGTVEVPDIAGPVADTRPGAAHVLAVEDDPTMPVVPLVVASGRKGSYYLLERQNAHAPQTGNGKRGWYRTQRSTPIRGIVVRAVAPHTAGAAASELATGTTPASAHVVVDASGALDLLPDDIVAQHDPGLDDAALVMLLAGFGTDAATDEAILSHAVAWSAAKMRAHGIPARRVSPEDFRAGGSGILSDDAEFPWHRMRTLVEPPAGLVDLSALLDLPPAQDSPVGADAAPPVTDADEPADRPPTRPPPGAEGAPTSTVEPSPAVPSPPSSPPTGPGGEPSYAPPPADASVTPASVAGVPFPAAAVSPPSPPEVSDEPPPSEAVSPAPADAATASAAAPAQPGVVAPSPLDVAGTGEAAPSDAAYRFASAPPGVLDAPPVSPLPPDLPEPPVPPDASAPTPPVAPPDARPAAAPSFESSLPSPAVPRPPAPPMVRPPVPPEPTVPTPRSPRAPRERRPLPTPDELIARTSGDTEYYLLEHENHHATLRANGKHGWYYPTRYGGIRAVVLHAVTSDIDTAEGVAAHLARVDQPEAAHAAIDPDTIVDLLPDDTTALHGVRSSSAALDLAVVYDPTGWGTDPASEEALLVRAAAWAGVRAVRHRIPVTRITVDDWHAGQRGFVGRGDIDPGADFPWHRFLQLTTWVARRYAASQPPPAESPAPPGSAATGPSETVRSGIPPT